MAPAAAPWRAASSCAISSANSCVTICGSLINRGSDAYPNETRSAYDTENNESKNCHSNKRHKLYDMTNRRTDANKVAEVAIGRHKEQKFVDFRAVKRTHVLRARHIGYWVLDRRALKQIIYLLSRNAPHSKNPRKRHKIIERQGAYLRPRPCKRRCARGGDQCRRGGNQTTTSASLKPTVQETSSDVQFAGVLYAHDVRLLLQEQT